MVNTYLIDVNTTIRTVVDALVQNPGYIWRVGEFGNCNNTCGSGQQERQIFCTSTSGQPADASLCPPQYKPSVSQACASFTSCSFSFNAGEWGSCSATCGVGTRERAVECLRSPPDAPAHSPASSVVELSLCDSASSSPASTEPCSDYSQCTYSWTADPWQACSTNCGSSGTRTRTISCRRSDGTVADTSICNSSFGDSAKPAESEPCSDTSGCPYAYVDECATGTHTCSSSAICTDTFGSFTCTCNEGFQGNGKVCNDFNECVYSSSCPSESSNCVNTKGSFLCECKKGFYLDGDSCTACPAKSTTPSSGAEDASSCSICAAGYYGEPSSTTGCSPCPFASTSSDGTLSESGCECVPGYTLNTTNGSSSSGCILDEWNSQQYLLYVSLPQLSCSTFCESIGKSCKGGLLRDSYTEGEIAAAKLNTEFAVTGTNKFFRPSSWRGNRWDGENLCRQFGGNLAATENVGEEETVNDLCLGQVCHIGLTATWRYNSYFTWTNGKRCEYCGRTGSSTKSGIIWWAYGDDFFYSTYDGIWQGHGYGIASWHLPPLCSREINHDFPGNCTEAGSAGMRTSYETFAPYVSASSTCYSQVSRIPGSDTCDETPTLAGTHRLCACAAPCTENYYGTGSNCTRCPSSSVSAPGSTSMSQCSCLPGYYMAAAEHVCKLCPALSSSVVGSVSITECECVAGAFMNTNGICQSCPVNTNSAAGSIGVESCKCSAGYYGDIGTACEACPHFSTSKEGATDITGCFCPKGFGVSRLGYSRQVANESDVCDVELSSTPVKTSGWHLTGEGESCEASCSARSLACNDQQNWEINSGPYMTSLVATPGFDIACSNIEHISDRSIPPLSMQASSSRCFGSIPNVHEFYTREFCDMSKTGFRRLCHCTCPANHYGTSTDDCNACPPNMVSVAGSRFALDCVCSTGYYRSDVSSQCVACSSDNSTVVIARAIDNFTANQDMRGWEGTNVSSYCGSFGQVLGGAGVLGDSAHLRKTYTNLCLHEQVSIKFAVVLMDGWEKETVALFVGGVPVSSNSSVESAPVTPKPWC